MEAAVLAEQLQRLAKLDLDVPVQGAPGDDERGGLGWRTRIDLVADAEGRAGMHGFRSHTITVLDYGRVISRGDVESVQNDPLVIEAYLGTGGGHELAPVAG